MTFQASQKPPAWNKIRCLLLDSDGVLTDGGVYLADGSPEFRRFDIKDGFGLSALTKAGVCIGIISQSPSTPVRVRAIKLGIPEIHLGVPDKLACAEELRVRLGLDWSEIAFMGDDIPDLPLLQNVGISMAPADASPEILDTVQWISNYGGGRGAVREACDQILRARDIRHTQ